MIDLDSFQRAVLVEGLEDYNGLWWVARKIRESMGEVAPDLIRKATIQRLRPLLLGGYIEAGYSPYQKGQFESWSVEGDVAVERIDLEWKKLGKDPNIWEVCWFKNTEKGNALARALQE